MILVGLTGTTSRLRGPCNPSKPDDFCWLESKALFLHMKKRSCFSYVDLKFKFKLDLFSNKTSLLRRLVSACDDKLQIQVGSVSLVTNQTSDARKPHILETAGFRRKGTENKFPFLSPPPFYDFSRKQIFLNPH